MLVFWSLLSLVRNSVVLAVYLLFSVACFFTVHEHLAGAYLEKQLVFYREEDCKLVQLYVYLSEYLDRPLDAHAFSQLETYLETLRQKRLRALLRFAYEEEADRKNSPVTAQILAHAGQISVWMEQHEALYTKPLPPFRQASTVHGANGILQSTITAAKN